MFLAHFVAGWLGLPTGIVIVAMLMLRKKGMAAYKTRKQRKSEGYHAA